MNRERLPHRRGSTTFEFHHSGIAYVATYSLYADGRLAELFVNGLKLNTGSDILAADGAKAASLALQYGCPVDDLRATLTRTEIGGPAGPLAVALDRIAEDAAASRIASPGVALNTNADGDRMAVPAHLAASPMGPRHPA